MTASFDQLRVFIVADDPLARSGLANLLAMEKEIFMAGQSATGKRLLADIERSAPDVVLWDLGWRPESVLEFLEDFASVGSRLPALGQGPPILALLPDETHAHEVRLPNVRGLLLRDSDTANLLAALRAVAQGLLVFDPAFAEALLRVRPDLQKSPAETLTLREMEVLQLLAEGLSNKVIAQRLTISEHTVKFHINSLMGKLSAQSRTDAVVRATRLGIIFL
ncbi:MAG: LuxR C-terminal-related transcriptional regulator [bacterium]